MKTWKIGLIIGIIVGFFSCSLLIYIPLLNIFAIPVIAVIALMGYVFFDILSIPRFQCIGGCPIMDLLVPTIVGGILGALIGLIIQKVRER